MIKVYEDLKANFTGKKLLLIQACGIDSEINECKMVSTLCSMYGIEVSCLVANSNQELIDDLMSIKEPFDYVYLSSHGNVRGFGNQTETIDMEWLDFSSLICESMVLSEDCKIFMSCCRGGLDEVAYSLFYCCDKISYVIGPRQSLTSIEMITAFNTFLFNIEWRRMDAVVACKKIESGVELRFKCFDKLETYPQSEYQTFSKNADAYFQQLQIEEEEKLRGIEPREITKVEVFPRRPEITE